MAALGSVSPHAILLRRPRTPDVPEARNPPPPTARPAPPQRDDPRIQGAEAETRDLFRRRGRRRTLITRGQGAGERPVATTTTQDVLGRTAA